jgi:antitoxin (DNA-binding transcriptional repressor) of toxin-antitoxin stability system
MTTTVTTNEILRDWRGYLQRVKAGETLVILEANERVAEIKPILPSKAPLRPYALCAGEFQVPEDFDDPLPDEVIALFEGL